MAEPNVPTLLFVAFRHAENRVLAAVVDAGYPITLAQARIFQRIGPEGAVIAGLRVQRTQLRHPQGCMAYRFDDGKRSAVEEDLRLCEKLIGARPFHASPFEHQATPDEGLQHGFDITWINPADHRNFVGWRQSRALYEKEIA